MNQVRVEEMPDDRERVETLKDNLPVLIWIFVLKLIRSQRDGRDANPIDIPISAQVLPTNRKE